VCLADKVVAKDGDYAAAFQAYQQARYLRTGRVQIMARIYGEFYHAGGVAKELRNMMLGSRTPEDAMAGMEWLYGEQKELTSLVPLSAKADDPAFAGRRDHVR
jgi:2-polyprenyl-6-methoxyphenol hydroxylase-like FAD-dependent oxidoreductase